MIIRVFSRGIVIASVCLLASCGGGGGGGGGNTSPSDQTSGGGDTVSSSDGLQLSKQQLTLSSEHGDEAPSEIISGVVNGASAPVYVYVQHTDTGINSVSFNQTSSTGGQLIVRAKIAATLTPGRYTDTIQVEVCYDATCSRPVVGSPKRIDVTYEVKAAAPRPTLLLGATAIAFAKVPFGEHLSHDIVIDESGAHVGQWSATTMTSWLSVTPTGTFGGKLTISANPQGLPPGLHQALVSVTSSTPDNGQTAVIRVGLYISQSEVANNFAEQLGNNFLIDPARPFTYSIIDSTLYVDHIYTGERLQSIGIPGVKFGEMAMNNDGSRLFIADGNGSKIWIFDSDQRRFVGNYVLPNSKATGQPETRRIPVILKANRRDILVVLGLSPDEIHAGYYMADAQTGEPIPQLFTAAADRYDTATVGRDGRHFIVLTQLSTDLLRWGQLTENSKGKLLLESYIGGSLGSALGHLNSDFILSDFEPEVVSCQGILKPGPDASSANGYVVLDKSLLDTFSWVSPKPDFSDESYRNRCYGIEQYGSDLLLITNHQRNEFHLISRDGTVQQIWMRTSDFTGIGGMKLSSDYLRVIDAKSMQSLPR